MKIGIVILSKTIGGPLSYGTNLVKVLASIDRESEYYVLCDDAGRFRDIPRISPVMVNLKSLNLLPWWDYLSITREVKKLGIQIFHNTKGVVPFFLDCRKIVTIHDMAPFLFPETFPRTHKAYLQYSIRRAVQKADLIITVSHNSKKDIQRTLHIDDKKIWVIHNGVDENFRPIHDELALLRVSQKYGIRGRIILYVGTLQPRKNIDLLIRAFYRLRKEKKLEHKLVIAGRKGWMSDPLYRLTNELGLEDHVLFTGFVAEEDLLLLYNLADIFVYPSSYEGFGLSVLEAMACGIPVITANRSSLPEIVGDAGVLLDSFDEAELAEAVWALLSNDPMREKYGQRGIAQARNFSWKRTAEETMRAYNSLSSN